VSFTPCVFYLSFHLAELLAFCSIISPAVQHLRWRTPNKINKICSILLDYSEVVILDFYHIGPFLQPPLIPRDFWTVKHRWILWNVIVIMFKTELFTVLYVSRHKPRLEAQASPRGSKSAASASPRRVDASPQSCLGLNIMTSKLRYDIIFHNFHPFVIWCIVFKTIKTKLCINNVFRLTLNVFGVCFLVNWV